MHLSFRNWEVTISRAIKEGGVWIWGWASWKRQVKLSLSLEIMVMACFYIICIYMQLKTLYIEVCNVWNKSYITESAYICFTYKI